MQLTPICEGQPSKKRPELQSKQLGHLGSRYIYIQTQQNWRSNCDLILLVQPSWNPDSFLIKKSHSCEWKISPPQKRRCYFDAEKKGCTGGESSSSLLLSQEWCHESLHLFCWRLPRNLHHTYWRMKPTMCDILFTMFFRFGRGCCSWRVEVGCFCSKSLCLFLRACLVSLIVLESWVSCHLLFEPASASCNY